MKRARITVLPPMPVAEVLPNGWVSIPIIRDAKEQQRWAEGLASQRAKDVTRTDD